MSPEQDRVCKPWMDQVATVRPYVFQQDGAPAHTSHLVQKWLLDNLPMFYLPDCTPLNYYLWGVLERESNKCTHNSVVLLKASIVEEVASMN
ncbi:Transposable element tcb2 transposase, partial [Caligus rogercresseyi]